MKYSFREPPLKQEETMHNSSFPKTVLSEIVTFQRLTNMKMFYPENSSKEKYCVR